MGDLLSADLSLSKLLPGTRTPSCTSEGQGPARRGGGGTPHTTWGVEMRMPPAVQIPGPGSPVQLSPRCWEPGSEARPAPTGNPNPLGPVLQPPLAGSPDPCPAPPRPRPAAQLLDPQHSASQSPACLGPPHCSQSLWAGWAPSQSASDVLLGPGTKQCQGRTHGWEGEAPIWFTHEAIESSA